MFKIKVEKFLLLILLTSMVVVTSQHAWASTFLEKESLRGLPGILLKPLNFISTPIKINGELPIFQLTAEIEAEFRHAGILLDEKAFESSNERPFLEIQCAVTQIAANLYAYTIILELHQQAALLRNASRPWVVTWSLGSLSTGDIKKFQDRLQLLVRMFIQDYKEVNARPAQARSISWIPSNY